LLVVWAVGEPCADEPCEESPVPVVPGRTGLTAADAGRAKITARIRVSMKAETRPLQAYTHTRSALVPTLDSPTLEGRA